MDLEIKANKGNESFVFYCFDNLSIGHNLRMTCTILVGFSAKRNSKWRITPSRKLEI